jgi:hypothetical protein
MRGIWCDTIKAFNTNLVGALDSPGLDLETAEGRIFTHSYVGAMKSLKSESLPENFSISTLN